MSDRILVDGHSCEGGVAVNDDGKIEEVFLNQTEIEKWLTKNHHVEVYLPLN